MDGFPLPPLVDMPGADPTEAKANATYYGTDMNWMIYHGTWDTIFPCNQTITEWREIMEVLGVRSTVKIEHIEPFMFHTINEKEFEIML